MTDREKEYYLITYGYNINGMIGEGYGNAYFSEVIDVHPAVWLHQGNQNKFYLHCWEKLTTQQYHEVERAITRRERQAERQRKREEELRQQKEEEKQKEKTGRKQRKRFLGLF